MGTNDGSGTGPQSSHVATTAAGADLPKKILIVETDAGLRENLRDGFHDTKLTFTGSREEALACLQKSPPGFIITELMSPISEGLELITHVRTSSQGACLPILVLTDQKEEEILLECFRRGVNDFVVKPFSMAELRIRVQSIFVRQSVARDANPLTKLPGNDVLKREITRRLEDQSCTAIAYIDLDHFKEFNDTQGFDRGDRVIQLVGDILQEFARGYAPGEIFVGHVGGDDFVAVLKLEQIEALSQILFEQFGLATEVFYSPEEIRQGHYIARNRRGVEEKIPLVSISIGVVTTEREGMDDVRRVAQVASEVKKVAKKTEGNSLFIDRRTS